MGIGCEQFHDAPEGEGTHHVLMSAPVGQMKSPGLVDMVVSSGRIARATLLSVLLLLMALLIGNVAFFQPRFDRAVNATTTARRSHEALLDQQLGLRGYLYTGDERFLDTYEKGDRDLKDLNVDASRYLAGEGEVGELYLDTRLAQEAWLKDWAAEVIKQREELSADEPVPTGFLVKDKELFDEYRQDYEQLISKLVVERQSAVSAEKNALLLTIALAILTGIGGLVLSVRNAQRVRIQTAQPIQSLMDRIDQIQHGDLAPRPMLSGPAEFQHISSGLEAAAGDLAKSREESEKQRKQLADRSTRQIEVLSFAREVSGSLSLRYVLRGACIHATAVGAGARVIVWLMAEDHEHLSAHADSSGPDFKAIGLDDVIVGEGQVGRAAKHAQIARGVDAGVDESVESLAIPMVVGAQVIGVLELTGPQTSSLSTDTVEVLETMAVHAAIALEAARLHEHTTQLAMTDALTGLPNRRRLDLDLSTECVGSSRYSRPLAFLMIDVDHFKHYNDTFGHQAGDDALREVAHVVSDRLRATDTAYRYGGEEFAILLRETTIEQASHLAERIRQSVEHHFAAPGRLREITVSIGIASLPGHGPSAKLVTEAADAALYQAKEEGRNRVVCAPDREPGPKPTQP